MLFNKLKSLKGDRFINAIDELASDYFKNREKKESLNIFYLSNIADLEHQLNVSKVFIPNAKIQYVVHTRKQVPLDINGYLQSEAELTEQNIQEMNSILEYFGQSESDFSLYYAKNHLDKLNSYQSQEHNSLTSEIKNIEFDSEIVSFDEFKKKINEHFPDKTFYRDTFISVYVYLIYELNFICLEAASFAYIKEAFEYEEGRILFERYINFKDGLEKYSLPIISI